MGSFLSLPIYEDTRRTDKQNAASSDNNIGTAAARLVWPRSSSHRGSIVLVSGISTEEGPGIQSLSQYNRSALRG